MDSVGRPPHNPRVGPADTHALVQGARGGDDVARGELLERLRPRLVLWAASRMSADLRSKVEPEDMAQEILLALHKSLDRFEGADGRAFFAWMFRVAENRIRDTVDHFGAKKRQRILPASFSQTSPSAAVARSEAVVRLQEAIETLPEDYRRVIQLRRLEERDTAEVAELLDRTENAVRILYCRALKALRVAMPDSL